MHFLYVLHIHKNMEMGSEGQLCALMFLIALHIDSAVHVALANCLHVLFHVRNTNQSNSERYYLSRGTSTNGE